MKDLSYYQMRSFLYPREKEQHVSLKLSELEQVWFCTLKNVKRKLRKFEEEGFYTYRPGKGRGNQSQIAFRSTFQEEIEQAVTEFVRNEQMEELMQLLQLPIPKSWIANISDEVRALFGLQSPDSSKDVLRSIITRPLTTLDPAYTSITFESYLIQQLGDPLVKYDPKKDSIKPHLAHHWTVDKEDRTWTFHLRKSVRFHHQRVLSSEDVLHTFRRIQNGSPHKWLLKDIVKMECPTQNTIRFHLAEPNPFFARYVSSQHLAILPADVPFDEKEWIGTGPFKLKEHSDTKIALEAFDQYFLERPLLDEIEFWHVPIDHVQAVTFQVDGVEDDDSFQEKEEVEIGFRFIGFNFNRHSIIHHRSFREAMYHLLDMKKMSIDLGLEAMIEASNYFPWKSEPQVKKRDLVAELLKEAGYKGETLTLYTLDSPKPVEEANWFIEQAKSFGISIQYETFSLKDFYTDTIETHADLVCMGEVASNDQHLSFLGAFYNEDLLFRRLLGCEQINELEEMLGVIKREERFMEREKWIERAEEFIRRERLFIYLYHPKKRRTFHPMIKDIRLESFGHVDLSKLWIHS